MSLIAGLRFPRETYWAFMRLIRLLNEGKPDHTLVEITINGPYSCVDAWSCSMTYCAQGGLVPDPGLSEEEAFPVYDAFDVVFRSVFPDQVSLDRREASGYVMNLMTRVCCGILERSAIAEDRAKLLRFSKEVMTALVPLVPKSALHLEMHETL